MWYEISQEHQKIYLKKYQNFKILSLSRNSSLKKERKKSSRITMINCRVNSLITLVMISLVVLQLCEHACAKPQCGLRWRSPCGMGKKRSLVSIFIHRK